jgi:acetyl esterase/lipase
MQQAPATGQPPAMTLRLTVDQFGQLNNANANPSNDPQMNKVLEMAAGDAREAIRIIRTRAGEWKVNPGRVGYMGFSAGGGVALGAVVGNPDKGTMPDFIGSAYGPSLIDVVVPSPAPPLFIATAADHMNVAAGCMALFMAWKKAGGEAEIHLYGKGKGAFGMTQQGLPSDTWIDSFYTWLVSEGF